MNNNINPELIRRFRTRRQWIERMRENGKFEWAEALQKCDDDDYLSATEVMDFIVDYEGGLGSGFEVRVLVNILYGGSLHENTISW